MDALLPAFLIALLAEIGDRTQLLALRLGELFRRPAAVIAGVGLAAILNMAITGVAGAEIAQSINHRAIQMLTGVALILAASGAAFRVKAPPTVDGWTIGPLLSSPWATRPSSSPAPSRRAAAIRRWRGPVRQRA